GLSGARATLPYKVNFWAELHNPLLQDPTLPDPLDPTNNLLRGAARLYLSTTTPGIYQLVIAKVDPQLDAAQALPFSAALRLPSNVLGDPLANAVMTTLWRYSAAAPSGISDPNVLKAANGAYAGKLGS